MDLNATSLTPDFTDETPAYTAELVALSQPAPTAPASAWEMICNLLQTRLGLDNFVRWFGRATATEQGSVFRISVENPIHQLWIESNYATTLADTVAEVLGTSLTVEIITQENLSNVPAPTGNAAPHPTHKVARLVNPASDRLHSSQAAFVAEDAPPPVRSLADAGLNPKFSFETFVVGTNSAYSSAVARAVAEKPGRIYNPLFFHGGSGLGKTHLMQAIGQEVLLRKKRAVVRYVTSEQFTNEFVEAIKKGTFSQFRAKYRKVDVLLIDDVHFLAGKDSTQEEFFHTFNELFNHGKQIVLASDRPPSEIRNLESRLVSRFEWGLTTQIQVPDYETRMAILRRKQADFHTELEPWIIEFMAQRIKGNVRKLEGALMRIVAHISLEGKSPTETTLQSLLQDVLDQEPTKAVTVDRVQRVVAAHFDLRVSDLTGPRRPKNIAEARQIAMFLVRNLTKLPLTQIGQEFGNRDHGTVIHACKVVDERKSQQPELRQALDQLSSKILAD
jgi:chromosomal replication initiator protein